MKGCNRSEFERLTGASVSGFVIQLEALRNLVSEEVSCHPTVMRSFYSKESFLDLKKKLTTIHLRLANELEVEEGTWYPKVMKRIERFRLSPNISNEADRIPDYFV